MNEPTIHQQPMGFDAVRGTCSACGDRICSPDYEDPTRCAPCGRRARAPKCDATYKLNLLFLGGTAHCYNIAALAGDMAEYMKASADPSALGATLALIEENVTKLRAQCVRACSEVGMAFPRAESANKRAASGGLVRGRAV